MAQTPQNGPQAIQNLQRYLRQLSFDEPTIQPPPVDGIFDTVTENALRAYQQLRSLPVTGRADAETWARLFSDYEQSIGMNRRGDGFFPFPRTPQNHTVLPGDEYFLVEVIQYILNELRLWYDDIPLNGQSGIYDLPTQQGILVFQRHHGLNQNENIDRATWNALVQAHRRFGDRNEL